MQQDKEKIQLRVGVSLNYQDPLQILKMFVIKDKDDIHIVTRS